MDSEVLIPRDWHSTYPQETSKEIGTTIYNRNRFYYMEKGEKKENKERKLKYKRSLSIWLRKH